MKHTLWLLVLGLPLAAQPKLLMNAKPDVQSAASGLEGAFRGLLQAQPQPAWIGYSVPAVRTYSIGCEYVSHDSGPGAGVMHLEPPDHAVILFRVVNNTVERLRVLSPDCEIDAGNVPFHWLNDVQPAQSVALLEQEALSPAHPQSNAVHAIAVHADPAADAALDKLLDHSQPEWMRTRVIGVLASTRGQRGIEILKNLIANDPDERIRQRAVSALGSVPNGEGVPLLIDLVRNGKTPAIRKQAMQSLEHSRDPRAIAFFEQVLKSGKATQ